MTSIIIEKAYEVTKQFMGENNQTIEGNTLTIEQNFKPNHNFVQVLIFDTVENAMEFVIHVLKNVYNLSFISEKQMNELRETDLCNRIRVSNSKGEIQEVLRYSFINYDDKTVLMLKYENCIITQEIVEDAAAEDVVDV